MANHSAHTTIRVLPLQVGGAVIMYIDGQTDAIVEQTQALALTKWASHVDPLSE